METAKRVFQGIYADIWDRKPLKMESFEKGKSALIIIDMVNGFVRGGKMKNPLAEELVTPIVQLMRECKKREIPVLAFADCHPNDSPEFDIYEKHCVEGSEQVEVLNEIKAEGGYRLIKKNSTNGFLEEEFQEWLKANHEIDQFIVVGVCTDICVLQFSLTLKAWFNKTCRKSRIAIPLECVETYDYRAHQITLINTMAVYFMEQGGMEIGTHMYY